MGQATTSATFNAPIETVFKMICDFSSYPKFMNDVKRVSIIESQANKKLVEFELQVIKSFRYQIWVTETAPTEVSWKFHTGEVFKDNSGSWKLKDLGDGKTHIDYTVSVKFGSFVPGMIEKKMIEVQLPAMIKTFKTRAESL